MTWAFIRMPFFNGTFNNRQIIIDVLIGHPHNAESSLDPNDFLVNNPPYLYKALVDTGATSTCISPKIAENLALVPEGKKPVHSATHKTSANLYHVSFFIPITKQTAQEFQVDTHAIFDLEVMEIIQPANYDVLLGMDVLAGCSLFIAQNSFTLGY